MNNKLGSILIITFILVVASSNMASAEMRSGISFDNSGMGVKLIEFIMENESFYLDFKSEYDSQEKNTSELLGNELPSFIVA